MSFSFILYFSELSHAYIDIRYRYDISQKNEYQTSSKIVDIKEEMVPQKNYFFTGPITYHVPVQQVQQFPYATAGQT